jgi:spore maturation protein CgeB
MLIQILEKMVMNKCALYIPRPGLSSLMVQQGYVDALRSMGWKVYVGDPKTKMGCKRLIEEYGVRLIMTHSRYGVRQLPVDIINNNDVFVAVGALPLNPENATIDNPNELAHSDEPNIIAKINSVVVHTNLECSVWNRYMVGWMKNNVKINFLPVAGNLLKALPPTCSTLSDVAMVANFGHRQDILKHLIEPLFKRIDLLGYSYQAFGDGLWQAAGLNYNGPLLGDISKLSHVYATARVCPNVHTRDQVVQQACINDRSFMIPLCGGLQVSDNPLAEKYLGSHCKVAKSTTDYMNLVIRSIEDQSSRMETIRSGAEYVSHNHTYFNRLNDLFEKMGISEFAVEAERSGNKMAIRHCWELDARLSAKERGVPYEAKVIGTS